MVGWVRSLHDPYLTTNPNKPFLAVSYGGGYSATGIPVIYGKVPEPLSPKV